jgi:hypothetical protein
MAGKPLLLRQPTDALRMAAPATAPTAPISVGRRRTLPTQPPHRQASNPGEQAAGLPAAALLDVRGRAAPTAPRMGALRAHATALASAEAEATAAAGVRRRRHAMALASRPHHHPVPLAAARQQGPPSSPPCRTHHPRAAPRSEASASSVRRTGSVWGPSPTPPALRKVDRVARYQQLAQQWSCDRSAPGRAA